MIYIYLTKLNLEERVRVNPDEIRTIESIDGGSLVTFKDNDSIKYKETPQQIERKEWRVRYLWPNLERLIISVTGGVIGSLLTLLFRHL